MRHALLPFFLPLALATAAPDLLADFIPPLTETAPTLDNETVADGTLELMKRQSGGCSQGYYACVNLNAPGLCCRTNQICALDNANHVACCDQGSQCTGTIKPVGSQPTNLPTSSSFPPTTVTTQNPFATITTTANPSFIQTPNTGAYVRSTVPNEFYPFAFIPTTYTNAAACSSAYSTCQADAASCTDALANGRQGVTVSAPDGAGAVITAVPSLGPLSASSICQSLSSRACYELDVRACAAFGTGGGGGGGSGAAGAKKCRELYGGVGAGIAVVGIAGQIF
ncbi:hypothetical protein BU24DRAFT_488757 [Aaosphaeria arxii CBS 175.79]|uniref:Uncharacterized protein n=1 Tax=Aaosphaeria arxii CBS 175.79 TaxID=1450172 RepID=A0A6A5Y178_9PLEO|nr:uncharacterized protein BU24DRAFT_488757 [Aaosphaeria arxii CBS 175.79]KAF2018671.1 hypothetical protein BU24DRAFT_488757 [Aaosphaeria arxii CBS 175.79]